MSTRGSSINRHYIVIDDDYTRLRRGSMFHVDG